MGNYQPFSAVFSYLTDKMINWLIMKNLIDWLINQTIANCILNKNATLTLPHFLLHYMNIKLLPAVILNVSIEHRLLMQKKETTVLLPTVIMNLNSLWENNTFKSSHIHYSAKVYIVYRYTKTHTDKQTVHTQNPFYSPQRSLLQTFSENSTHGNWEYIFNHDTSIIRITDFWNIITISLSLELLNHLPKYELQMSIW